MLFSESWEATEKLEVRWPKKSQYIGPSDFHKIGFHFYVDLKSTQASCPAKDCPFTRGISQYLQRVRKWAVNQLLSHPRDYLAPFGLTKSEGHEDKNNILTLPGLAGQNGWWKESTVTHVKSTEKLTLFPAASETTIWFSIIGKLPNTSFSLGVSWLNAGINHFPSIERHVGTRLFTIRILSCPSFQAGETLTVSLPILWFSAPFKRDKEEFLGKILMHFTWTLGAL